MHPQLGADMHDEPTAEAKQAQKRESSKAM